ncbi:hypothetical protein HOY80DRAFT_1138061 [Tuber brumale]|nr:hypothetical protein HOY80DRAFT_1138061 [Tuber brumale]
MSLATPDIIPIDVPPLPIPIIGLPSRLTDIGPDELLRIQSNKEGRLKLGNISATELDNWKSRYPKFFESEELRFEYNFLSGGFLIKCMPLPTHDSLQTFFSHTVSFSLDQRFGFSQASKLITVASGTTFSGFAGDPTGASKKLPDAYVRSGNGIFPTVVCEAGWAEGHAQLIQDARLWLLHTRGQTRVVIVVAFTENSVEVPTVSDNSDNEVTTTITSNKEQILLESISEQTNTSDLAESLLLLNRKGELRCPLVGNLEADLHVYRASATGDDICESFATKFFPTPTVEDSGPKEFGIKLGELLGDCIPEGENPDEEVKFSLDHLKECLERSLPHTERLRATDRALSLLRSRVGLPDIETFAQCKRRGVDPFTLWKRA